MSFILAFISLVSVLQYLCLLCTVIFILYEHDAIIQY